MSNLEASEEEMANTHADKRAEKLYMGTTGGSANTHPHAGGPAGGGRCEKSSETGVEATDHEGFVPFSLTDQLQLPAAWVKAAGKGPLSDRPLRSWERSPRPGCVAMAPRAAAAGVTLFLPELLGGGGP